MASNIFKVAFAVLILGWAPLLACIAGGAGDHVLGSMRVLARAAVTLSLLLASVSGIVFLMQSWRESRAVRADG